MSVITSHTTNNFQLSIVATFGFYMFCNIYFHQYNPSRIIIKVHLQLCYYKFSYTLICSYQFNPLYTALDIFTEPKFVYTKQYLYICIYTHQKLLTEFYSYN